MPDNTTVCPHCGARVWYAEDRLNALGEMRCVCGESFTPTELTEFKTAVQKRAEQDAADAKPIRPRPAPRKAKTKKGAKAKGTGA